MQQQSQSPEIPFDESTIGVPHQLCSVCGDTSTGKINGKRPKNHPGQFGNFFKEFILAEIVAKVAKRFSVVRSNVIDIKITNVPMMVSRRERSENEDRCNCSCLERCPVNIVTRKVCQFCRYQKCTRIGMKPKWFVRSLRKRKTTTNEVS